MVMRPLGDYSSRSRIMKNPAYPHDPLFQLERKIARRADELTRKRGIDPNHALARWEEAEREVWDRFANARGPAVALCESPRG